MLLRLALVLIALLPGAAMAASWRLDPDTRVAVEVPWQGRQVEVRFLRLSGSIDFDENHPETAKARVVVAAESASTGASLVDSLVMSRDYLGAEQWPDIVFQLDRLTRTSPETADVAGRLTLRGVTLPVVWKARVVRYGPSAGDPGRFEAAFDISGSVDRTAFGSRGGLPEVGATLGLRIRLAMSSR